MALLDNWYSIERASGLPGALSVDPESLLGC